MVKYYFGGGAAERHACRGPASVLVSHPFVQGLSGAPVVHVPFQTIFCLVSTFADAEHREGRAAHGKEGGKAPQAGSLLGVPECVSSPGLVLSRGDVSAVIAGWSACVLMRRFAVCLPPT